MTDNRNLVKYFPKNRQKLLKSCGSLRVWMQWLYDLKSYGIDSDTTKKGRLRLSK